jgi:FAD/FMN-containing dehydrogenase
LRRTFIVTANVPEDVLAAVQFAADYGLKVSALGGGHQLAGLALPLCGVTIEMYKLQYLDFDNATNLATVQASPPAPAATIYYAWGCLP